MLQGCSADKGMFRETADMAQAAAPSSGEGAEIIFSNKACIMGVWHLNGLFCYQLSSSADSHTHVLCSVACSCKLLQEPA